MIDGVVAIWMPGPDFHSPTIIRHQASTGPAWVDVQYVNVNSDGDLNHYEPVMYDVADGKRKGKRKRVRQGSEKGGAKDLQLQKKYSERAGKAMLWEGSGGGESGTIGSGSRNAGDDGDESIQGLSGQFRVHTRSIQVRVSSTGYIPLVNDVSPSADPSNHADLFGEVC
eukprot:3721617-Rhodomonas_salina.2